jgi:predicted secreted protein
MPKLAVHLILISLFLATQPAIAKDAFYNQISLNASASEEVANDVLVAILTVQETGYKAADLATLVNKKMAAVLDETNRFKAIKSQTTSYNSQPIYKNGKIASWQVNQQIQLTSQNFEQLSQLIGKVNELAQVQSMTFKVSDDRIETTKEQLTKTAITQFKEKALSITEQFDKHHYQLIHVTIDGNHSYPQPVRMARMAMEDAAISAPTVAAGTNKITVTVHGTIELLDE